MLALCFVCDAAAKWGPCEHQYAALLHAGLVGDFDLPMQRARGRPPSSAGPTGPAHWPNSSLVPGPRTKQNNAVASSAQTRSGSTQAGDGGGLTLADQTLQALVRRANCGRLFLELTDQQVTVAILERLSFNDFKLCLGIGVASLVARPREQECVCARAL